jgi:hypothetical protein
LVLEVQVDEEAQAAVAQIQRRENPHRFLPTVFLEVDVEGKVIKLQDQAQAVEARDTTAPTLVVKVLEL